MAEVTPELIVRVQNGDQDAFDELYAICYPMVYAMAFKIMKNRADSEDVTQDVFITIHKFIKNLREPTLFYAWLHRVVTSRCMNHFNKKKFITTTLAEDGLDLIQEQRNYMTPQGMFSYGSDSDIMCSLINELPMKYRDIFILVYFKQMKLEEIATALDVPLGTVKTRVKRAREMLQKKISLFEKKEGRKLDFNIDLILPTATYGGLSYISMMKSGLSNSLYFQSLIQVACAAVICVGAGGILHETILSSKESISLPVKVEYEMEEKTIGPFMYQEIVVNNSKEAYFLCVNWAKNEQDMNKKTKGQFRRIKPIYDALKYENNQYYQMLVERNWANKFEQYLQEYHL